MNLENEGESKSVANVVEVATISVLALTLLEMQMFLLVVHLFHPVNKLTLYVNLQMKITMNW